MKSKRLIINLISNIFSFVLQLGINFIITPIITEKVGDAAYGFIGLANNFVSYANIFTVIINSMASRFITFELTKGNKENANKYFSSVLLMDIIMSIIIAIASAGIIITLQYFLNIPNELVFDVKLTFLLAFINLIISVMNTVFSIATFAKNRLDLSAIGNIIANIVKAILLIILFNAFVPKIYYITISAVLYSLIVVLINFKFTKKLLPELKITTKNFDKVSIIKIIKSGIWNAINSLGKTLLTGLDLLIANLFLGADAMGLISISKTIPQSIENLLVTIANIFSPQFIYYYSQRKIKELIKYVNFSIKLIATLLIVPIAGFIAFGTDFFRLWLPSKTTLEINTIQMLSILALAPYFISMGNYSLFLLDTATNKLKRPVIATLIISIFSTVSTILALKFTNLGIYAVAGISSIFWCIKVFFFNTINAAKNLRVKWYTFYPQYLKNLSVFSIVIIVFYFAKRYISISSWIELFVYALILGILGYILVFLMLFNKEEKKNCLIFLKSKINTIKRNRKQQIFVVVIIFTICLGSIGVYYKISTDNSYKIEQLEILNVAKEDNIQSEKNEIINQNKFIHISLDDFIIAFEDISKNNYDSIFENDTFSFLKMLNDKYGAIISCYTYYENDNKNFNLSECTDRYAKEFEENSDWLKFGFHTYNGGKNYAKTSAEEAKNDYNRIISELIRITGSEKSIDKVVRLQNFAGNEDSVQAMKDTDNGIIGVLGADDKRRSYYLNDEKNSYLYKYDYYEDDGVDFFKTDLRMELIENIDEALNELKTNEDLVDNKDILIIFTHEWQLTKEDIKIKLEKCCEFAKNNGYEFDYPMNRIK